MNTLARHETNKKWIPRIAKAGLTAKGIVYCLIGVTAFLGAFDLGGQSDKNTNKQGILSLIQHQFAGRLLLAILIVGLLCYCIWRGIQAFRDTENKGKNAKGVGVRSRYLLSGLIYLSFAIAATKFLFGKGGRSGGDGTQKFIGELLAKPFGQYLTYLVAAIIAGVGIYQIIYGLFGKYKKHVSGLHLGTTATNWLLKSGTIGYVARGIVWLVIAWLMFKAAMHQNAKDAGDTNEAFLFLHHSHGPVWAALLGLGLLLYGIFNFIRAAFERFNTA